MGGLLLIETHSTLWLIGIPLLDYYHPQYIGWKMMLQKVIRHIHVNHHLVQPHIVIGVIFTNLSSDIPYPVNYD